MRPLIVAAPASGSGKTSVTLGLLAALRRRGLEVAPFKVGPDYIDPGHHAAASGRVSRNLDGWMCGRQQVMASFSAGTEGADLAVIEGVMGLYDGAAADRDIGSTAEIARWLQGRILLVVDARSQARSVAALVRGFADFGPDLDFAGVVLNRVGSARHADLLGEVFAAVPGLPPLLGCLPRSEAVAMPERHLGLWTAGEADMDRRYQALGDWIAAHVDLERLLADQGRAGAAERRAAAPRPPAVKDRVPIAVARDAAFSFYYPENLELLERAGAELRWFSPLEDAALPVGAAGVYLGGGYPELYAARLAANRLLLGELHARAMAGLPVYAECGGLMLLAEGLQERSMVGVFPGRARLLDRRRALGYREVRFQADTPLGPAGLVARGHEFHYSELSLPASCRRCYAVTDRRGEHLPDEGYLRNNALGSYIHLHFGSNPALAENFVRTCRVQQRAETQAGNQGPRAVPSPE